MRKTISICLLFVALFVACNQNKQSSGLTEKTLWQSELVQMFQQGDSLFKIGKPDTVLMRSFIEKAVEFAEIYPEEEISPELLMCAGETGIRMAESVGVESLKVKYAKQSLDIYNQVQKVYPDYADLKMCYFNRGVIYDDILQDYESAKFEYSDFIHKYPDDSLSVQLKVYIQHLGKSPEEIMQVIKESAK